MSAHEIHRQRTFLLANPGVSVPQETRGFNENTFETYLLRSKEDALDYRYMPDPNLGVLVISQVGNLIIFLIVVHDLFLIGEDSRDSSELAAAASGNTVAPA